MIGAVQIVASRDGTYRPDPSGQWAAVTGVHDRYGELCDLVAWAPEAPARWWLRYGDETPVLGAHALAIATEFGDPIALYPTPQAWLLAGRKGICIIKWSWPLDNLFVGVAAVECSSAPLQRKLISALRKWEPRVTLRREVRHAA